jgi:hypothetical protein
MTLVDGISKLMGETRKGGRFRLKDSGMVPMNILKSKFFSLHVFNLLKWACLVDIHKVHNVC